MQDIFYQEDFKTVPTLLKPFYSLSLKCSHFWAAKEPRICSGYPFRPFANLINHSFYYPQSSCFKIKQTKQKNKTKQKKNTDSPLP